MPVLAAKRHICSSKESLMRSFRAAAAVCAALFSWSVSAANHSEVRAPLPPGPFPVACSNVAQDAAKIAQLGGQASDYWEGNNGYITQILAEPNDVPIARPRVPDERGFYPQTANSEVPFAVFICYPTTAANTRADYRLPDGQPVPKMQRAGDRALLANNTSGVPARGVAGQTATRLPLLVFSHGLGSSPLDNKSVDFLVKLAAHGYIVAAPFHADARFSRIRLEGLDDVLYIVRNFENFVELQALRPLSVKATIDLMLAHPDFGPQIDRNQIGGIGGSMGGATMTWLAGAHLTTSFPSLSARATVQDPRIRAMVGYVPYAGQRLLPAYGDDNATAVNVKTPYLAIGGTADTTAPTYLMEQAMNNFQSSRYFIALKDVPHGYEQRYADDAFGWSVMFFDAYLRGRPDAMAKLTTTRSITSVIEDSLRIDYTVPTAMWLGAATLEETYSSNLARHVLGIAPPGGALAPISSTPLGQKLNTNAFRVITNPALPMPRANVSRGVPLPVCLFSGTGNGAATTATLLTNNANECAQIKTDSRYLFRGTPFYLFAANNGQCAEGLLAVTRLFNGKTNPAEYEYRYTTSNSLIASLVSTGWRVEPTVMCAPL
jgi:dienelactone hydrolase